MEWTITVHKEKRYVEVVSIGIADKKGSLDMAKEIVPAATKNRIKKVLIDHGNIRSVSGDTFDVVVRPKQYLKIGGLFKIRIAEVIKPEHEEFFKFLETVYINRGFAFKVFFDKETALQWLLGR